MQVTLTREDVKRQAQLLEILEELEKSFDEMYGEIKLTHASVTNKNTMTIRYGNQWKDGKTGGGASQKMAEIFQRKLLEAKKETEEYLKSEIGLSENG